ncbi:MAG TPA: energy-coupling factor transporter transmembrane component T [Anaerolineae bacterium]|nr:energy-coupling factor transporter transmembrane component T [Anaerolineae bacterium]HNT06056.1 energy-coupling factor transporter transmembrane component T [Anaerolineae bacterium]
MLDARVWLVWVVTALVASSVARNPLYAVLLLLITVIVGAACRAEGDRTGGRPSVLSPLRFAALAIPLSGLFNALSVHFGDTVLFRLPGNWPFIGGPVTLEAFTYGAQNGIALSAIFAAFMAFNLVTPVRDLVGIAPRAFHETGVVISIALTFIPQTVESLTRIRHAQAVRGHRLQGLRDWPPIVLPLLISGLEQSMGLAEAMVARGYGAVSDQRQSARMSAGIALSLLVVLTGWLTLLFSTRWRVAGLVLMGVGAGLMLALLWSAGRSVPHTSYRPRRWTVRDTLGVAGCGLALAAASLRAYPGHSTLYYMPYPRLTLPPFAPLVGLGLLGLLAPAILAGRRAPFAPPLDGEHAEV